LKVRWVLGIKEGLAGIGKCIRDLELTEPIVQIQEQHDAWRTSMGEHETRIN